MNQTPQLTCPQCLHLNEKNSQRCDLCDWPLGEVGEVNNDENVNEVSDKTVAPQMSLPDADPNQTIAPDAIKPSEHQKAESQQDHQQDPGQTVAPEVLTAQKKARQEKNTFHLAGDLAHFEIHEILGQGGMGAVYHAKDKTLQRDVAIKMLRPVLASNQLSADALLDEARMASKLNHPNIVTIYDVARADDSNYIVMEWVDGQPLDELIPEGGLDLVTAMSYACQIADGLNSAHQKYIIHRDIKPQNIMRSTDGTLKILDFGIAGLIKHQNKAATSEAEGEGHVKTTAKTMAVGTPSYMSPEQARGLNLDQRSDIFSFGTLLYQMLCGQRPFQGKDIPSIQQAVCEGSYEPIQHHVPDLPIDVVKLLDKMLVTQKDQRWQSSAELAEEMHRIYAELTYKKNWWERRHWLSKAVILIPFVIGLGWGVKDVLFPASTQQLIERQLAEANKIAILPFENISGDPLIQLFGDGLAVNLGSDLAAIAAEQNNTWIVPATEISRMKDQSLKAVADKYGVNLVLTGSIQHMGSTRLLVLNLLNAVTGQQVKTAEVSIQADELFQGHGLIRTQALELLDWSVPKDLTEKFNAERPQLDGAYREYIRGRGYLYRDDQQGNLLNSIKAFDRSISIDANYQLAYVGLAEAQYRLYTESKDISWLKSMENTVNELKIINKDHSKLGYLFAQIVFERGDYSQSVVFFSQSIKRNPQHIESFLGLALAHEKLNEFDKAEKIYKHAKSASPNNMLVISYFGVYYFILGEYERAVEQFKEQIELAPNNHWAYLNMAASYYSLGKIDEAIKFTEVAIDINPSADSYSNLGTMYFYQSDFHKSVETFEKMISLNDTDFINWGNLADAYQYSSNEKSLEAYTQAAELATQSLLVNPQDTMAIAAKSYYLANLNQKEESMILAKKINQNNTGLEHFIVATAYSKLGELDRVFKHLNLAIDKGYPIEEIMTSPLLDSSKVDDRFKLLNPE